MRDFHVGVGVTMTGRRFEHGVNGLVREIEEERSITIFPEPVYTVFRDQVGYMSLTLDVLPVHVEGWIGIHSLASKADPVIETRSRLIGASAHVPFSDESGIVSGSL